MSHSRSRSVPAIVLAGALAVPLLLVFGARSGTGQEKAAATAKAQRPGQEWTIESHDRTNFPLVGKHRTLGCRECHINLVFEGTPTDCEVCHWERRQDDRYSLRLGTRCADCHTPQSWKKVDPALWSHETNVGFRLEGIHRTLDCEACHGTAGFTARPTDCFSCHESDYRGAQDPNHVQAGFPTTCPSCHTQRSLVGRVVQPHRLRSPGPARDGPVHGLPFERRLPGHVTGVRVLPPRRLQRHDRSQPPRLRVPHGLRACHGTSAAGWSGANFDHPFPIQSGRHSGVACSECHQTSDFRVFNCLGCHEQATTNSHHNGVTGYSYNSQACYACHPQGSAGGRPATKPAGLSAAGQ